jgi:hypothetical protein
LPSEFEGDSGEVVVLSHDLWRNRFSSDSNIVGRDVRIGERMRRVIGVMPPSLRLPEGFDGDLYLPMTLRQAWPKPPFAWYKLWALGGIGRLRPGVERAQAQAEIDALTKSGSHLLGYRSEEKIRLSSFNSERYESSASKMFGVFFGSVFLLHAIAPAPCNRLHQRRQSDPRAFASAKAGARRASGPWRQLQPNHPIDIVGGASVDGCSGSNGIVDGQVVLVVLDSLAPDRSYGICRPRSPRI